MTPFCKEPGHVDQSKAATARCDEDIYISYRLSGPQCTSCTRLAEIMKTISHDSVNRFLDRERFQVRNENPIKNHVFCAIKAFVRLECMRLNEEISHWYEIKRDLYIKVIRDYINGSSKINATVNA